MPRAPIADDQRGQALDFVAGETRGGFVQQQEIRLQHQRARDLDEAQFAVLQAIGADVGERLKAYDAEQRAGLVCEHALVAPVSRQRQHRLDEGRSSIDAAADHDILQHRGLADHARRLEGAPDAVLRPQRGHAGRQHATPA